MLRTSLRIRPAVHHPARKLAFLSSNAQDFIEETDIDMPVSYDAGNS